MAVDNGQTYYEEAMSIRIEEMLEALKDIARATSLSEAREIAQGFLPSQALRDRQSEYVKP